MQDFLSFVGSYFVQCAIIGLNNIFEEKQHRDFWGEQITDILQQYYKYNIYNFVASLNFVL
jgi:hypothetical protein